MRRLPIYFLIDVSESMVGEPIQLVEEGLATIVRALKEDPYALETVYISIIVFAGKATTLVPLQEITAFYPPKFPIGGGTSLGNGLQHLITELKRNIVTTTAERKGDWKPIVFLFTDGVPTDNTTAAIREWQQHWSTKANMVSISFGKDTDLPLLRSLTEQAYLFSNTSAQQYKEFFRWVSSSIKSSSISVDTNGSGFELAKAPEDVISKIDLSKKEQSTGGYIDTNFAVFAAKCQRSKRPYLIKYRRDVRQSDGLQELGLETLMYRLVGGYPVDTNYFELSGATPVGNNIRTEELEGFPACPCCGNQYGFAVCTCTHIHCIGQEEVSVCPWCGNEGRYGYGDGSMEISRTQG